MQTTINANADLAAGRAALRLRNRLTSQIASLPALHGYQVMQCNEVQAGLDALDPESPYYVSSEAIQTLIYVGTRAYVESPMTILASCLG